MRFDTIIANGTVVHAKKTEKADVGIVGEKIAAVGKGLAKKAGGGADGGNGGNGNDSICRALHIRLSFQAGGIIRQRNKARFGNAFLKGTGRFHEGRKMRRVLHWSILLLAMSSYAAGQDSAPTGVSDAVQQLEMNDLGISQRQLYEALEYLECNASALDEESWNVLLGIASRGSAIPEVRLRVFELLCKIANSERSQGLVELASAMQTDLLQLGLGEQAENQRDRHSKTQIVMYLALRGWRDIQAAVSDQSPLLLFLEEAAVSGPTVEARHAACLGIRASPAPLSAKRESCMRVINRMPRVLYLPEPLVELLDTSCAPPLRQLLTASEDPMTFHYGAAAALAEIGDAESLPCLENVLALFENQGGGYQASIEEVLQKLRLTNPSTRLLEYIVGTADPTLPGLRQWAVARALRTGIPAAEVRTAMLSHLGGLSDLPDDERSLLMWTWKRFGMEHGVLLDTDLPNISVVVDWEPEPTSNDGSAQDLDSSINEPARQPWFEPVWRPNDANYDVLVQWMMTINWDAISEEEGLSVIREKMCELDLIHPYECPDDIATSQP